MSQFINNRIVAIVGRPNVGKSALFNRIVGKRISIVHEEVGVTRDRISAEAEYNEKKFELIDTGGLSHFNKQISDDILTASTEQQAEIAIADASFILFVVDITSGIISLDNEVAKLLHKSGRKVIILANKADNEQRDGQSYDFDRFGFPVFPVSALQNRGIESVLEEIIKNLPDSKNITVQDPLRVAVVGRPNSGKSSYINRLLKNDRVIVSDIPGTTRDSIEIPFSIGGGDSARNYQLIDTAGIQKNTRSKGAVDWFSNLRSNKSIESSDVSVLIIDAETGPTSRDKKIAASIINAQKGCLLLVNKWDLAQEADEDITQTQYLPALRSSLPFLNFAPILFISAKSGYNIKRSIEAIDYVAAQTRTEISTGVLNRIIQKAIENLSPPMTKGKRLKIYYATQSGTNPIYFKIFVNNPDLARSNWVAYLKNQLRNAFGLEGAPIFIKLLPRSRD
ncbi:MAG: ribosome biogenesis GTPase Der [Pontiellaceae bacterium]